ncbi:hypothetical protein OAM69_06195 [bacterium]|nr:hypothetical protein [bacterium]
MMADRLKYPDPDAALSVLEKIGVDPKSRDLDCQDFEYTTCEVAELDKYVELYERSDTSIYEKRVLGCYIMETLNDFVSAEQRPHHLQDKAFEYLYSDYQIHQPEIEKRTDIEGRTEDLWWPIAKYLIAWQKDNTQ